MRKKSNDFSPAYHSAWRRLLEPFPKEGTFQLEYELVTAAYRIPMKTKVYSFGHSVDSYGSEQVDNKDLPNCLRGKILLDISEPPTLKEMRKLIADLKSEQKINMAESLTNWELFGPRYVDAGKQKRFTELTNKWLKIVTPDSKKRKSSPHPDVKYWTIAYCYGVNWNALLKYRPVLIDKNSHWKQKFESGPCPLCRINKAMAKRIHLEAAYIAELDNLCQGNKFSDGDGSNVRHQIEAYFPTLKSLREKLKESNCLEHLG